MQNKFDIQIPRDFWYKVPGTNVSCYNLNTYWNCIFIVTNIFNLTETVIMVLKMDTYTYIKLHSVYLNMIFLKISFSLE